MENTSSVNILLNTINRYELTPNIVEQNLANAQYPHKIHISDNGSTDHRIIDWGVNFADTHVSYPKNIGNPQSLNNMVERVLDSSDYIVIMGNDIELPKGWLEQAIKCLKDFPKIGMLGFNCSEGVHHVFKWGEHRLMMSKNGAVIGTVIIDARVFRKIGYFNEFAKYGYWDGVWSRRVSLSGWSPFFLYDYPSKHISISGEEDYKSDKMEQAESAWSKAKAWHDAYGDKVVYLNKNQNVN